MKPLIFLCIMRWTFFDFPPIKSLLLLEFLYLILTFCLLETGVRRWWVMFVILFSACERVFILTVFMLVSRVFRNVKIFKFFA